MVDIERVCEELEEQVVEQMSAKIPDGWDIAVKPFEATTPTETVVLIMFTKQLSDNVKAEATIIYSETCRRVYHVGTVITFNEDNRHGGVKDTHDTFVSLSNALDKLIGAIAYLECGHGEEAFNSIYHLL